MNWFTTGVVLAICAVLIVLLISLPMRAQTGPLPQQQHGVYLTWTASANAAGYKVYRCFGPCTVGSTSWILLTATPITTTSFLDNSVGGSAPNLNTQYSYVIAAVDSTGNNPAYSNVIQQTTPTAWPTTSTVGPTNLASGIV